MREIHCPKKMKRGAYTNDTRKRIKCHATLQLKNTNINI